MNVFTIAVESLVAPLKKWRLFLRALVPVLLFCAILIGGGYQLLESALNGWLGSGPPLWELLTYIGLSLFDWNWLGLLRMPEASWLDRLRGQIFTLVAFATISWGLNGLLVLLGPLQSYAESFDPVLRQTGNQVLYATSFQTAGIGLVIIVLLVWLRLRLLLWPADIFAKGRLSLPIDAWRMTKEKTLHLIAMITVITIGSAAIGGLCMGIDYLVFSDNRMRFGLLTIFFYSAALEHAYLACYRALQPTDRSAKNAAIAVQMTRPS